MHMAHQIWVEWVIKIKRKYLNKLKNPASAKKRDFFIKNGDWQEMELFLILGKLTVPLLKT